MAANKQQGKSFALFLVGGTIASAGLLGAALGKVALIVGLVLVALSLLWMFKIKSLEGKVSNGLQPPAMKLAGVATCLFGWLIVLFGLHLSSSVGGRMVFAIVGILVSLIGSLVILPAACNKNAIWKA
ncbi:MAG TPA: hypothetical protein VIJ38_13550 [Acidobacteriaceae bacterium]